MFVSVATTFYSFAPSATKVLLGQCSRVALLLSNSLANQKLTFDERISCITRHDDFSSRSHRAVSLKLLLSSEISKAETIVIEPVHGKRVTIKSFGSSLSQIRI